MHQMGKTSQKQNSANPEPTSACLDFPPWIRAIHMKPLGAILFSLSPINQLLFPDNIPVSGGYICLLSFMSP